LYGALTRLGPVVCSGTNVDDLDDHRPGLQAAAAAGIHHPFVVAGMRKDAVRDLALSLGLPELAALPSSPCLSSRVETGIRIRPEVLLAIDDVERFALGRGWSEVRCRVRATGIVIEHGAQANESSELADYAERRFSDLQPGPVSFAPYRRGSAFLRSLPIVESQ
jgi:pyridinium-3,5-biscarboxylic acid mononucleotide sulfurtransferase